MKPETLAIHAANLVRSNSGDVTPPINLSTTFFRDEMGAYPGGHMYSRVSNPNRSALENTLSKLEFGADAAAFASGNYCGMAVFQALKPGSHLVAPDDMYWGLKKQLLTIFNETLTFDFVDQTNLDAIEAAIKPETALIWTETPSNPLLKVTDVAAIAQLAKKHHILSICDSTFASPILQNPIALGFDMVMHSSTKYLGGHSDVLGGIIVTAQQNEFWARLKNIQQTGGGVPSPFDCFLLSRSIKTLAYRIKGHCENAMQVAEFLNKHQKVASVFYPGLPHHPQHLIAKKQMKAFGGMLSFLVKGDETATNKVVNQVKLFAQATSLGGVESLIEHRYSVEGPDSKTPKNLLRVSVGLEHIDDLLADLDQALNF